MRASRSTGNFSSVSASIEEAQPSAAIEINQRVRGDDEWFDEPDDIERVESALRSIDDHQDPVETAALVASRVTRAQGLPKATRGPLCCRLGGLSTTTD